MVSNKKIATLIIITLVGLAFTGCSDDSATTAVAVPAIDTAPPAVPANLDVAYVSGDATISWTANTEADLAGYVVVRENAGVSQTLATLGVVKPLYTDSNPPYGSNHYSIYSVDDSGNQSAVATVDLEVAWPDRYDRGLN